MNHLIACLVRLQWALGVTHSKPGSLFGMRQGQLAVAAGPVGTAEARIGQPGVGAEADDQGRQPDGQHDQCVGTDHRAALP
ncbi:hypothetical protein WL1483_3044 [Aeromonas schubertii]|uniref:Uncharacterized protein n=1 Tax=Aeromonas schubertii TaxID=652 RepID=A0A0S2SL43_9GAMM|nr:hypothetical protein WL1483_3044 [Aeromonas schubertii]